MRDALVHDFVVGRTDRPSGQHGVSPEEFEAVVFAASMVDIESSHTSDYCVVRGRTITGRDLLCVFDALDDVTILPITAYEPQPE